MSMPNLVPEDSRSGRPSLAPVTVPDPSMTGCIRGSAMRSNSACRSASMTRLVETWRCLDIRDSSVTIELRDSGPGGWPPPVSARPTSSPSDPGDQEQGPEQQERPCRQHTQGALREPGPDDRRQPD